jgi:hypothetical protein
MLVAAPLLTLLKIRRSASNLRSVFVGAIWALLGSAVFFLAIISTQVRAAELASGVLKGQRIPPAGTTFLFDFHADPVCVHPTAEGATSIPGSISYGLYLGEAEGWVVIFDPLKRVTKRMPADGLVLSFIPGGSTLALDHPQEVAAICAELTG